VDVNFTQGTLGYSVFDLLVGETGLPSGTPWVVDVGGTNTTLSGVNATLPEPAGAVSASAAPVVFLNGTEYIASVASVAPFVQNLSAGAVGTPVDLDLNGSYAITFHYAPQFLVTASSGVGGNVSPASTWVPRGGSVNLTATPNRGYQFLGWVGSGTGSTGTTLNPHPSVAIFPGSAVTETATFAPRPTVYFVSAQATGLPTNQSYTVGIGGTNVTGDGTLQFGNLTPGWYALTVPTAAAGASVGIRYLPGSVGGVTLASNGSFDLTQNLSLRIPFEAEFAVSEAATSGGTVGGSPGGSTWVVNGSSVNLTATPIEVTPGGPVQELARFGPAPVTPPTSYAVHLTETGLPTGSTWGVAIGNASASGSSSTLTLPSLPNGTYVWTVPTVVLGMGQEAVANASGSFEVSGAPVNRSVGFTVEVLVTVSSAGPGAVTPNGTFWWPAGTSLALSATPSGGGRFLNWSGVGTSSYSGSTVSTTVTPTGPITEIAQFGPATPSGSTTPSGTGGLSDTSGLAIGLGLFALLAVVGLLLGRRGRSTAPPLSPSEASPSSSGGEEGVYRATTPRPPDAPAAEWSEPAPSDPSWAEEPPQ
jgi:hypothetical protein